MNGVIKTMICICIVTVTAFPEPSFVFDNCDDGNPQSSKGGWWYTFNDQEKGGNSYVIPTPNGFKMSGPGFGNKGYAAHMKGTAGDKLGWDYVGMGVTISESCGCPNATPVNMKEFTKIQFKMKGSLSGGRLIINIPYTENKCSNGSNSPASLTEWADYEAPLTAKLKPDWTTVELDLRKDFHQPRWTKQSAMIPIDKVLENIKNINFHYSSPDGDSIDLWVDEIEFIK